MAESFFIFKKTLWTFPLITAWNSGWKSEAVCPQTHTLSLHTQTHTCSTFGHHIRTNRPHTSTQSLFSPPHSFKSQHKVLEHGRIGGLIALVCGSQGLGCEQTWFGPSLLSLSPNILSCFSTPTIYHFAYLHSMFCRLASELHSKTIFSSRMNMMFDLTFQIFDRQNLLLFLTFCCSWNNPAWQS